ncbi:uncharacterized protein TNCV_2566341 [Trichonephila clavipes]|nr:uncharacterized protein TNCV_2566341 [Trichonephila clavipes]
MRFETWSDKPQTLDHLEDIRRVIADIRLQMLEKVIVENWTSRRTIRASRGKKIELREDLKSRRGLAVSLEIICHNCGESTSTMSSKISNKCYDVNLRLTYGMRAIGKGGAAARIFCGLMNLPPPPANHRLDIKHMKTVTYRPQANITERVNRNLVQMIASFVEENHENWDQFLHQFAFALRTAQAHKCYGGYEICWKEHRKIIDEARQNMQISISLGKNITISEGGCSHQSERFSFTSNTFLSAAGRKQVRVYRPRQTDTISSDSLVEILYDEQEVSLGSNRSNQGQFKEHRKTSSQERVESIAGPSRLPDRRRTTLTTIGSRTEDSGRDDQTRQTRATTRGRNKQAEKPVRSSQAITSETLPILSTSRRRANDGIPEELRNIEINVIPLSKIRRRSLRMEALDGDPVHRI